jgi:hypothetical protein
MLLGGRTFQYIQREYDSKELRNFLNHKASSSFSATDFNNTRMTDCATSDGRISLGAVLTASRNPGAQPSGDGVSAYGWIS